jgi:multiple sugar transport system permease protein
MITSNAGRTGDLQSAIGPQGASGGRRLGDLLHALPFLAPWIVGFLVFTAIPLVLALYWSFTNYNVLQAPQWIGLSNYQGLVQDSTFWQSVRNTLYIAVIGIPLGILLALGIAVLLNNPLKGLGLFRAAVFLPAAVPDVAIAITWLFIFNPDYGLLNSALNLMHIRPLGWLGDPNIAKVSILMMVLWGQIGQIMVILLAGMKDVPRSLYEAAMIDGANAWQQFRHVTLPMIGPVIFYNIVVGVVFYFQFFTQAFVISSQDLGAPAHSTLFYSLYLYQNAFQFLRMGYASAMAFILFVVILVVTILLFQINRRFVYYAGG